MDHGGVLTGGIDDVLMAGSIAKHSCSPPLQFRPSAARLISGPSRYCRPPFSQQTSGQRNLTRLLEVIAL